MVESEYSVKITHGNTKLGMLIPSVNLPPVITCRAGAPCNKGCYALRGRFVYEGVKNCLRHNLDAYTKDADKYFEYIDNYLSLYDFKYFRWHSSGDIVNEVYLLGMIKLAKKHKKIKFLCFTKKYELVNSVLDKKIKIPVNLKIVFSNWGAFKCENPHNLPMTYVHFNKNNEEYKLGYNDQIPVDAIPCTGKCYECFQCWNLMSGQAVQFKKH